MVDWRLTVRQSEDITVNVIRHFILCWQKWKASLSLHLTNGDDNINDCFV